VLGCALDSAGSGKSPVSGCCEKGNEHCSRCVLGGWGLSGGRAVKPDYCQFDARRCLAVSARPVGYRESRPSVVSSTLKAVAAVFADTAEQV
jgi:hypothetical protein